jgi:hypothetical protein
VCTWNSAGGMPFPLSATTPLDAYQAAVVGATTPTSASNVVTNGSRGWLLSKRSGGAWRVGFGVGSTLTAPGVGDEVQLVNDVDGLVVGQAFLVDGGYYSGAARPAPRRLHSHTGTFDFGLPGEAKGWPVLANGQGYVSSGSQLVRFSQAGPGTFSPIDGTAIGGGGSSPYATSPVLGKANSPGQAEGYAVTQNRQLVVFPHSAATFPAWQAPLPSSLVGDVVAHPALGCAAAGRPAPLYVGTVNGQVASILVDASRLEDSVDAWPKYQRSMGNSGNTQYPVSFSNCP